MHSILIANSKGGSGKTTLTTNLAGALASAGQQVVLLDADRQASALGWLARRSASLALIKGEPGRSHLEEDARLPDADYVLIDAPAGLRGDKLKNAVRLVDRVLVPLQPSPFDQAATQQFLTQLAELKPVRKGRCPIALVANRLHPNTHMQRLLQDYLQGLELPVLAYLRDIQLYLQLALEGSSVLEQPPARSGREREAWQALLHWAQSP